METNPKKRWPGKSKESHKSQKHDKPDAEKNPEKTTARQSKNAENKRGHESLKSQQKEGHAVFRGTKPRRGPAVGKDAGELSDCRIILRK